MTADGLILPCHDCGKAIAIVKVGGVLAYGHLVNPTFMHHEAKPPRMRPTSRSADEREPSRAVREDARRLIEAPVSGTGYQVRRRVSLSTPAPHSHDPSLAQAGRPRVRGVHDGSPSQPFRPSEGASLKRGPSLAPTHPLSAATRSTPPGRS
jgi:hypothetical protein